MLRTLFSAAAFTLVASIVAVKLVDRAGHVQPSSAAPEAPASISANSRSLVIRAAEGGHFAVDARIDGRPVAFLVDTGASQVTLRASDAARLGLHPSPRDYSVKVVTANGEGRAAPVQLSMVEVGDITVRNVSALVAPDEALGVNLLGMSFLSRVRWSHERGRLILEQ
jgi:aspartyl protease family protein